jgi:hypothetical protein
MKLMRKTINTFDGKSIGVKWTIYGLYGGKWSEMSDENGPMRFDSAEERDAALAELKPKVANL